MPRNEITVLAARRTPVGRPGGQFAALPVELLGAAALGAAAEPALSHSIPISHVIMGNTVGPGGNIARVAMLEARLDPSIPALTIDRQCGSGLDAIHIAASLLARDDAVTILAGGVESVSTSPMLRRMQNGVTHVARARMSPEWLGDPGMAEAAEYVAQRYSIERPDQDRWAVRSVQRTLVALERERLEHGITDHGLQEPAGAGALRDEWRDRTLKPATLARYPALTRVGRTVTAANSAPPADGAAALLLGSERLAHKSGLTPIARLVAYAAAGVSPDEPGMGPVPALRAACLKAGVSPTSLDRVEINEAFAAQVLACIQQLDLDPERVNPEGGSIALGHPFGATGALLLVRLVHGLSAGQFGAVTLGIGGGQGVALVVERM